MNQPDPFPTFSTFQNWYEKNYSLVEDLQTWLFYSYAQADGKFGKNVESQVEVADMTVYLLLFYLSQENNYNYSFRTSIKELSRILETEPSVVKRALNSLEEHHMIHFHSHDDEIHITINPISVNK